MTGKDLENKNQSLGGIEEIITSETKEKNQVEIADFERKEGKSKNKFWGFLNKNLFKSFKVLYLVIFLAVLILPMFAFGVYAYVADPWILIKGQKSLEDQELKVSIGEQELKVEKNKFQLSKNLSEKEITVTHPDYKTKKFSYKKELSNLINPTVVLEPVDYAQIILNLNFQKENLNGDLTRIFVDGGSVTNFNSEYDGKVVS